MLTPTAITSYSLLNTCLQVNAIRTAAESGLLTQQLKKGVTGRASSLLPPRCPGIGQWSYGALPHIQPHAQNDIVELALGIDETSRFYASVMALFAARC